MTWKVTPEQSLAVLSDALGLGQVVAVHHEPLPPNLRLTVWWVELADGRVVVLGSEAVLRNTTLLGARIGHPGPIKRSRANRIEQALRWALVITQEDRDARALTSASTTTRGESIAVDERAVGPQ